LSDNLSREVKKLNRSLSIQREMIEELGQREADSSQRLSERMDRFADRMDFLGVELIRIGEVARKAGEEAREAGAEARLARAKSTERFNQLAARLRLTEDRNTRMLQATDASRAEVLEICRQLDARVTALEKRTL